MSLKTWKMSEKWVVDDDDDEMAIAFHYTSLLSSLLS